MELASQECCLHRHSVLFIRRYVTFVLVIITLYRPISRVVIGREVDYRSRLVYVRYCLANTTLCL